MYSFVFLLAAVTAQAPAATEKKKEPIKPLPPGMVQVEVGTLHCPSCAKKIARQLYKTPGVVRVKTDMKRSLIWITVQPKKQLDLAQVWEASRLKDVEPQALRIGDRLFVGKDFEKAEQTAGNPPVSPRR